MKIINQYTARIPEWALSYVINGDDTGLTDSEKVQVESFLWGLEQTAKGCNSDYFIECTEEEHYFTWTPEFGLGCIVQDCNILFLQEENQS